MSRMEDTSIAGLRDLSQKLDDVGYYSVLLVYHSLIADHWLKAARIMDLNHKIKYMIAIRTYAISPEYCKMMCKAFNEIQPNRLMLNVLSGHIQDTESSFKDLIYINDQIADIDKRNEYTETWIKKFKETSPYPLAEIVMSGHSEKSNLTAKEYADYHLSAYGHQAEFTHSKNIVSAGIIIRDTFKEAEDFFHSIDDFDKPIMIYGTKTTVIDDIIELSKNNVTDVMLQGYFKDKDNWHRIHEMSKELLSRFNK